MKLYFVRFPFTFLKSFPIVLIGHKTDRLYVLLNSHALWENVTFCSRRKTENAQRKNRSDGKEKSKIDDVRSFIINTKNDSGER